MSTGLKLHRLRFAQLNCYWLVLDLHYRGLWDEPKRRFAAPTFFWNSLLIAPGCSVHPNVWCAPAHNPQAGRNEGMANEYPDIELVRAH